MRGSILGKAFCWCFVFILIGFVWITPVYSMDDPGGVLLSQGRTRIEINPFPPEKEEVQGRADSSSASNVATSSAVLFACPSAFERQVVFYINQERNRVGLSPLVMDVRLLTAARQMSADMASVSYVPSDHIDSTGRSFDVRVAEEGGYPYNHLGEVIAGGFATPQEVVMAWMNSPGHKARLLDEKYEHIGVGYLYDLSTAHWFYWAVDLGATSENLLSPSLECESGFYNLFQVIMQQ
jgi:uncharacterized protein YkwD